MKHPLLAGHRWHSTSKLLPHSNEHLYIYFICKERKKENEVTQSCPTVCDPVDCSLPGSSVHGILQARILEWVAISFSRGSSRPRDQTQVFCIAGRRFRACWDLRDHLSQYLVLQQRKLMSEALRWFGHLLHYLKRQNCSFNAARKCLNSSSMSNEGKGTHIFYGTIWT